MFSVSVWMFLDTVVVVQPQSDHHSGADTHMHVHTSLVSEFLSSTLIFSVTITLSAI